MSCTSESHSSSWTSCWDESNDNSFPDQLMYSFGSWQSSKEREEGGGGWLIQGTAQNSFAITRIFFLHFQFAECAECYDGSFPAARTVLSSWEPCKPYGTQALSYSGTNSCPHPSFLHSFSCTQVYTSCCSVAMYFSVLRRDAAHLQHVCLVRI